MLFLCEDKDTYRFLDLHWCTFKEMFFKKTQNLSGSIFFQTRLLCFYK